MFPEMFPLLLAVTSFVASHFLLSHRFRAAMVNSMGVVGFQTLYSIVAMVLIVLVGVAYHFAPHDVPLWSSKNLALQFAFDLVGYFAVVMFVASLPGNPALVGSSFNGLSTRLPTGVFLVTRHPMMFAITIWPSMQLLILPTVRNLIVCGGLIVLALIGSVLQDRKLTERTGREWRLWAERTPFWPNLLHIGAMGQAWLFGLLPWVFVTWLESRVVGVQLGLWYLFPDLPY